MRLLIVKSLLVGLVAVALFAAALVAPARAQSVSEGCATLNESFWDSSYTFGQVQLFQFAGGEKVTMSAGEPTSGTPTTVTLLFNGVEVDTAPLPPFPGTVEFVIPTTGTHTVRWTVETLTTATWTVSCEAQRPDLLR